MTLTIDVPERIALRWNALSEDERRERFEAFADSLEDADEERPGYIPPTELKFVTETSPEVKAELVAHAARQAKALEALYAQWATEKEDDIDLETLTANMNANRATSNQESIF